MTEWPSGAIHVPTGGRVSRGIGNRGGEMAYNSKRRIGTVENYIIGGREGKGKGSEEVEKFRSGAGLEV
jgi:hypothetical protein